MKNFKRTTFGRGIFTYPNGDLYLGTYWLIPPTELAIAGSGMYICKDKEMLVGEWSKNELTNGRVRFPCGVQYQGGLSKHLYNGKGVYSIPGVGRLIATWKNHCPLEMVLVDRNGHKWRGKPSEGVSCAELHPVNQFLESSVYTGERPLKQAPSQVEMEAQDMLKNNETNSYIQKPQTPAVNFPPSFSA